MWMLNTECAALGQIIHDMGVQDARMVHMSSSMQVSWTPHSTYSHTTHNTHPLSKTHGVHRDGL